MVKVDIVDEYGMFEVRVRAHSIDLKTDFRSHEIIAVVRAAAILS